MRAKLAFAIVVVCAGGGVAHALTQPDGTPIPTKMGCDSGHPTGLAPIFASQCTSGGPNIGAACPGNVPPASCDNGQHGTCETTIWHAWNDDSCIPSNLSGLSPQNDASTTPETFQPTCALTFTELSRGTAQFHDVFGWYNVTGHAPDPGDLHVMLDCNAPPGTSVVLDLVGDPAYKGGQIGFFIATPESHAQHSQCDGGNCCASIARLASAGYVYYSQRELNPDAAGAQSYIHLLTYDSELVPHKFYFAWEDLYAGGGNDDFTDMVTSVDGVECAGGGQSCDTGMPGICAQGVSACANGQLGCTPLYIPKPEICDGLDQDCDGAIDEGATCPDGDVCSDGKCRPSCASGGEFGCQPPTVCDPTSGACVDPACNGVTCPNDAICSGGQCVTPCDGVVCPHGQECAFGKCIDRCANVVCPQGQVCREGSCFPGCDSCNGIQCGAGLVCGTGGGDCVDPSCPNGCPSGTHCNAGACADDCDGAVCPAGETCVMGQCGGGDAGVGGPGNGDGGIGGNGATGGPKGKIFCGCSTSGPVGAWPIALAMLLLVARRRRRRC